MYVCTCKSVAPIQGPRMVSLRPSAEPQTCRLTVMDSQMQIQTCLRARTHT